ncbi:hypothetical protein HY227_02045 [Candidatus Wolfebacteria bacterium]|nr:hypothetical protein [Candidatus Wolfebacteria bacterium]
MLKDAFNKKILLVIAGLATLLILLMVVYVFLIRNYPVALVNWHFVRSGDFQEDLAVAISYYGKADEAGNKETGIRADITDSEEARTEIKRAVLDKLIEDNLIEQELKKRIGDNDLKALVDKKIESAISGANIEKEVKFIYGLSMKDFRKKILEPQAKSEILEGRLLLENNLPAGGFEEWLLGQRTKAKVVVLLPGFSWNGKEVKAKK